MAKKNNTRTVVIVVAVLLVAGIALWLRHSGRPPEASTPEPEGTTQRPSAEPALVSADRVDPANEGKVVTVRGKLDVGAPAEDPALGVKADGAVVLLRYVDMLQWRERCKDGACEYQKVWSPQAIASANFREKAGHENPPRLPMAIARFVSRDVRLGAFAVDAAPLANFRFASGLQVRPTPFKVPSAGLAPNLSMTFRDFNGALYAGDDPSHPAVGDVRVIYRTIPALEVELTGVQRGDRLMVQRSKVLEPAATK